MLMVKKKKEKRTIRKNAYGILIGIGISVPHLFSMQGREVWRVEETLIVQDTE